MSNDIPYNNIHFDDFKHDDISHEVLPDGFYASNQYPGVHKQTINMIFAVFTAKIAGFAVHRYLPPTLKAGKKRLRLMSRKSL